MPIKPSTIDKYLLLFDKVKSICDNHGELHIQSVASGFKATPGPFYSSVILNYFRKIDLEHYECLVGKFERTHVRKIIEYTNNRYRNEKIGEKHNTDKVLFNEQKDVELRDEKIIPPLLQDVEKYCNERKNDVNPAKFMAYYEQKGWKVGKEKMKNWKMAIHTWEHKNYNSVVLKKLSDYSDQELIDELKRRGYSGLLEIKREISF
jgi:hypothetical protein